MENLSNSIALEFQKRLNSKEHKQLFKKASSDAVCNCAKGCDCSKDACGCKKSKKECTISCKSCGKEKTVEAWQKVCDKMLKMSDHLDTFGFEKQATFILKIAEKSMKNIEEACKTDSNDVRMKDLKSKKEMRLNPLEDELAELEQDPDYMTWAQNPEYSKYENLSAEPDLSGFSDAMDKLDKTDIENYIQKTREDSDPDLLKFLDNDEDESNADDIDPDQFLMDEDLFPDTDAGELTMADFDEEPVTNRLITERSPMSFDESAKDKLKGRLHLKAPGMPKFTPEELWISEAKKLDNYFKKQAKKQELEDEEDEDFEDED